MSSVSNNSQESLVAVEVLTTDAAQAAPATTVAQDTDDARKQPWRQLPTFESFEDKVRVNNVRDMRLYGNHVNAHS
ncbi:MAG: hypothetical protein STHCBS139747_002580 [Sporothrix thermara]